LRLAYRRHGELRQNDQRQPEKCFVHSPIAFMKFLFTFPSRYFREATERLGMQQGKISAIHGA
jgi:hypothetical protein